LNEPLTGRKWEYELFPLCWEEYEKKIGFVKAEQQLENRLLYGFYPEVINNQGNCHAIMQVLQVHPIHNPVFYTLSKTLRSVSPFRFVFCLIGQRYVFYVPQKNGFAPSTLLPAPCNNQPSKISVFSHFNRMP
jgi:hypothetical protein